MLVFFSVTKFSSVNVTSDPSKNSNASLPKFEDQTHTRMYKNSVSNSNLLKDVTDSGFEVNVSDLKESMNKAAKKIHDKENCLGHNGSMVPKSPRDKSNISNIKNKINFDLMCSILIKYCKQNVQ